MTLIFIKILARYIAALFVAFVASFAIFFLGLAVMFIIPDRCQQFLGVSFFSTEFAISGFAGVFSGALCLEQKSRRSGSIILLVIGLGYSVWLWLSFFNVRDLFEFHWLPWFFWPLMVGGTTAVLLIWFKSGKKEKFSK